MGCFAAGQKNSTEYEQKSVVLMHVDVVVPPGIVAQMQNNGLNIHVVEFVIQSKSGNYAKVYQAVDSSGTADSAETLSLGRVVRSYVREEVSKTDEREIAGDHDVDRHEPDVLWLEQSEQMGTEVSQ